MKNLQTYIILAAVLCSCSGKFHLKQAKKHLLKAEMMGETWAADTIFKEILIPVRSIERDTIVYSLPGDTVVLEKDRLKVTYVRLRGDTVFLAGECLPDTIRIEVPVSVEAPEIEIQRGIPWWWLAIAFIGGALALLLIRR